MKHLNIIKHSKKNLVISLVAILVVSFAYLSFSVFTAKADAVSVSYKCHIQDTGWTGWVVGDAQCGTTGQSLRMEAVQIRLNNAPGDMGVKYRAHVQNVGWQEWVDGTQDGATAGTTGRALRMEAVRVELTGSHIGLNIQYRAHVQNVGWQDYVSNGATAGTTGQSLRMEAMNIKLAPDAKQLTIAAPTVTLSKPYDGNTTVATCTPGELSGLVTGSEVVTASCEATYATAAVGTGKTINVVYTISGADAAKYDKPVDGSVATGVITEKQLTIGAPTVTLSKLYDGNTTVATCTPGELSGLVTGSEAVTASCVATYATAAVGTGKTINVVYTISGADAAKYDKPVDGSVATGVITGVMNEAQLRAALAGSDTTIALGADITLTSYLNVARDVTIDGAGFTLTRVANDVTDTESYAVMVSSGMLTASNLKIVSTNTGTHAQNPSAVGITVQTGAGLNLSGSTITAEAVSGLVYGVYAQGSNTITLDGNHFIFSGADTTANAHRIMLGVEGIASTLSLTNNTITSTLHPTQQEIRLVVNAPGSTLAAIRTYAAGLLTTGQKLRVTDASDIAERTIFTRTADGWTETVTSEARLLAALAGSDTTIALGADITLTSPLSISRDVTIDGNGKKISGRTITVTAGNVALNNMTLTDTENQQLNDGNYGIMVQGGSLVVDSIHMTVATDNADNNVGFNVAGGASLDLRNSLITITDVGGTQQQYAVYTQSGAGAVALTGNTFTFNARNSSGAYSYLIGMQGDAVANYPSVTLGTNTNGAYIKLLLVGADTLANKEGYAEAGNKVAVGERLGIIGTDSGIYYRLAGSWVR